MTIEKEIKCTKCGSSKWIKAGWAWRGGKKNVQRHRCCDCGKLFVIKENKIE